MNRFREWVWAKRSRFFAVTGIFTIGLIAVSAILGVDYRVLGGLAFAGALWVVVVTIQQGSRWDGD